VTVNARWQWTSTPGMNLSIGTPSTLDCTGGPPETISTTPARMDSGQGYMTDIVSLSSLGPAGCTNGGTATIDVTVTLANGL